MVSILCRIKALQENIYHVMVYICQMMDHMFADDLVNFINHFVLDSNAFKNVDWNKIACNESSHLESNSLNQEFNLKLNSDLGLDDLLKVKEA